MMIVRNIQISLQCGRSTSARPLCTSTTSFRTFRPPKSLAKPNLQATVFTGPTKTYERSSTAWLHGLSSFDGERAVERQRAAGDSFRAKSRKNHAAASAKPDRTKVALGFEVEGIPGVSGASQTQDDGFLRQMFDSPYAAAPSASARPTGLFLHPNLRDAQYFTVLTGQTLTHAHHLVDRITRVLPDFEPTFPGSPFRKLDPSSSSEYAVALRQTPKLLDRLSDVLCLVMDMAELVRNVHPEQKWVQEADTVYEVLGRYMNGLNTHQGLYEALKLCRDTPHEPPLTDSERQLIQTFMNDFEKSGIHLETSRRQRFVDLSDEIQVLGRRFLGDVAAGQNGNAEAAGVGKTTLIELPQADELLQGLDKRFIQSLPRGGAFGAVKGKPRSSRFVPTYSWEAQMILRHAPNSQARRLIYEGSNAYDSERVGVLEDLLQKRGELAGVLGKDSWAEVQLTDKMAKNPSNVEGFLGSLAENLRPRAMEDVATLGKMKNADSTGLGRFAGSKVYAWDRDYYTERLAASLAPGARMHPIGQFFSAGTVVQGLSRLFNRLYGLRFVPAELRPGEAWSSDVRKVHVMDDVEGLVGIIYFDLFNRPNKSPNAAHYTVRCSRRIDNDDALGDRLPSGWDWSLGMTGVEDFEGVQVKGKEGRYQLPLVVLTTDFVRPTVEDGPSLLAWPEVETLFHEMGHAIHSMLGRTEYHNVSGTRCATDFVELPSILMESFVSSPDVLPLFARHYRTDMPLPIEHFKTHMELSSILTNLETNGQIMMASLDQKYHSPAAGDPNGIDTTQIYHDLQAEMGVIPPVPGTAWQAQFGHLYGYGATYYSYLFDRAIAKKVWSTLFKDAPLTREGGEKFRNEVLRWGGGKDPWEMVAKVVGDDSLAKGDWKAMEKVGKWLD